MILGTRNFEQEYNGSFVPKQEVWKMLDYAQEHGMYIDTAYNYAGAHALLAEYDYPRSLIITKIWKQEELWRSLEELKTDKLYCCMARENNPSMIEFLKDQRVDKIIDKIGMSIYYPHELRSDVNVIEIPCAWLFGSYLKVMRLYAKVIARSLYKLNNGDRIFQEVDDYVVGCDSLEQLKENYANIK